MSAGEQGDKEDDVREESHCLALLRIADRVQRALNGGLLILRLRLLVLGLLILRLLILLRLLVLLGLLILLWLLILGLLRWGSRDDCAAGRTGSQSILNLCSTISTKCHVRFLLKSYSYIILLCGGVSPHNKQIRVNINII